MTVLIEYVWLLIVGGIVAFMDAFGIGANDVANSFNTAVASGCISYGQAILIALFTEASGAILLGQLTADEIMNIYDEGKLDKIDSPIVMLMMCCALIGSSTWTITATKIGWPVSTSQAIIGGLLGVGIVQMPIHLNVKKLFTIIGSWFIAPLVAGCLAAIYFVVAKYVVLIHQNSFTRGLIAIPIYFAITFGINSVFVINKNKHFFLPKKTNLAGKSIKVGFLDLSLLEMLIFISCISFIIVFSAWFGWYVFVPWVKRKVSGEDIKWFHMFYSKRVKTQPMKYDLDQDEDKLIEKFKEAKLDSDVTTDSSNQEIKSGNCIVRAVKEFFRVRFSKDINKITDKKDVAIHESVTKFDNDTEYLYGFLQVVSACFASFAHGSNDVANSLAPLRMILMKYFGLVKTTHVIDFSAKVYCAMAIDVGLVCLGYKVMRTLGSKITFISPSRGFSIEMGTCLTVLTCSNFGLPVSTTHCITGATTAIGLCNGSVRSLNWKTIGFCLLSCLITLPCAGITSGAVFYAIRSIAGLFDKTFNNMGDRLF